ncbi:ribulose-phosphate 3-epimerase [Anaerostipes butyraticus]|mgnify:FL=1|uniref:ribulose-phosphate 3-epimerase n=1 Tax=Anaerostipes butyraticus TaxID=645466 RepID=A0A916VBR5_9FIRM|nr:ribulose-phosphate 3-epimerase [Anaerostipes butyraticus]GFO84294.1 ribulose-phosphate 3-epimerase [Anaerostipes butyraticus]
MIINPSLLNANTYRIKEQLDQLKKGNITHLHIDIADGHFVPVMSFGANTVRDLKKETDLVLDCHMMVEKPEEKIPAIIEAGADIITVHAEATAHIYKVMQKIQGAGRKAGVALNPGTPISMIEEILPFADLILCMTSNPGMAGETFINSVTKKIEILNEIRKNKGYRYLIEADGSINEENISFCRKAGADLIVSGRFIFDGKIEEQLWRLRMAGEAK